MGQVCSVTTNDCFVVLRCPPEWKGDYCQTNIFDVVASSSIFDFIDSDI